MQKYIQDGTSLLCLKGSVEYLMKEMGTLKGRRVMERSREINHQRLNSAVVYTGKLLGEYILNVLTTCAKKRISLCSLEEGSWHSADWAGPY